MSGKKGGRVPRPADPGNWTLRFLRNSVGGDWDRLCAQMPEAAVRSYDHITADPRNRTDRCKGLEGDQASKLVDGKRLDRWQFEMTSGGRIFYLIDEARKIVWVDAVHFGHPKKTEKKKG